MGEGVFGVGDPTIDELVKQADFGQEATAPRLHLRIPNLTFGANRQWTFRDGRQIPKRELARCFAMLHREVRAKYPVELRCNQRSLVSYDIADLSDQWGGQAAIDFLKQEVPKRTDQAWLEGDVHPIMFGVYNTNTGLLLGSFQWAGLKLLSPPRLVGGVLVHAYSALPISAFVWLTAPVPKHKLTLDVIERFLNHPGHEKDGKRFMIREVHAPLYRNPARGGEWDRTIMTWEAELEKRRTRPENPLRVNEILDPAKPRRKYQVIRKAVTP